MNKENIKTYGYIALGVGILYAGYKLLQKVDLIPDKQDKEADKLDKILSFWQSKDFLVKVGEIYFKKFNKSPKITELSTAKLTFLEPVALSIYKSKGLFNDNEEKLYSNFRKLSSKIEFYQLNNVFQKKYEVDILDFVTGYTSSKERAIIYNIIKGLPISSLIKLEL